MSKLRYVLDQRRIRDAEGEVGLRTFDGCWSVTTEIRRDLSHRWHRLMLPASARVTPDAATLEVSEPREARL